MREPDSQDWKLQAACGFTAAFPGCIMHEKLPGIRPGAKGSRKALCGLEKPGNAL